MTSLTWRPRAGLLPFRARVGTAAGLGLAGAGWGRAGGHVRLCRCPQGLRGPLWRSLDQPWAPGRALGTAVGQSRPGREAAEGSSPVCSPPALDWPPPLTRWQLRCLVQTQPRSGPGGRPSPHPGRLEAPGSPLARLASGPKQRTASEQTSTRGRCIFKRSYFVCFSSHVFSFPQFTHRCRPPQTPAADAQGIARGRDVRVRVRRPLVTGGTEQGRRAARKGEKTLGRAGPRGAAPRRGGVRPAGPVTGAPASAPPHAPARCREHSDLDL